MLVLLVAVALPVGACGPSAGAPARNGPATALRRVLLELLGDLDPRARVHQNYGFGARARDARPTARHEPFGGRALDGPDDFDYIREDTRVPRDLTPADEPDSATFEIENDFVNEPYDSNEDRPPAPPPDAPFSVEPPVAAAADAALPGGGLPSYVAHVARLAERADFYVREFRVGVPPVRDTYEFLTLAAPPIPQVTPSPAAALPAPAVATAPAAAALVTSAPATAAAPVPPVVAPPAQARRRRPSRRRGQRG